MSAAVLQHNPSQSLGYASNRPATLKPTQSYYLQPQQQPAQPQPAQQQQQLKAIIPFQFPRQMQSPHQLHLHSQPPAATKPRSTQVLRPIDANQMRPAKSQKSYQQHQHLHPHTYQLQHQHQHQQLPHQPAAVLRRNARERNRVKQVNNGFTNLRQHLPGDVVQALTNGGRGASKKLSKVDTLKVAVEYIRRLQEVLIEEKAEQKAKELAAGGVGAKTAAFFYPKRERMGAGEEDVCMSPTPSSFSDHSSSDLSVGETLTSGSGYSCGNSAPPIGGYRYATDGQMNEDDELLELISSWQHGEVEE